jgi:recombinational DNA repair ATPase RecF
MLTEVCLRDFKNHVATTIKPGRMTCLVGPNGCGKTSVLEAIQFVSVTAAPSPPSSPTSSPPSRICSRR